MSSFVKYHPKTSLTGPPKWHSAKPETVEAAQNAAAFCRDEVC